MRFFFHAHIDPHLQTAQLTFPPYFAMHTDGRPFMSVHKYHVAKQNVVNGCI